MTIWELIQALGGVGLFLFGMTLMSTGLKNAAGDKLRGILERVTSNRFAAAGIGLLVTILVQSSSATDMMVIGFVHAGLMSLSQAVGVVLGANVGTTITAQITAFNLSALAPALLFLGVVAYLFIRKSIVKHIGTVILGFGMLFVGVGIIKSSIAPLADSPGFIRALSALSNPFLAVLFGVAFTALLQSSSSSVVIFQAFAAEGLLTLNQCAYLVIGAAIGAVAPNLLAGMTTGRAGRRAALINLFFNLFRACVLMIALALVPGILKLIASLSPGDVARQVANMHSLFALVTVAIALPMSEVFVKLAERAIPLRPEERKSMEDQRLIYMIDTQRNVPAVAMREAMLEINRMGRLARDNLAQALDFFFDPEDERGFQNVEDLEGTVDFLNHAISDRLVGMQAMPLSDRDKFRLSKMILVVSNFERISDHAENVAEFAVRLRENEAKLSEEALKELREMGDTVLKTLDVSMTVFAEERFELVQHAMDLEETVDRQQEQFIQNHIDRLMVSHCDPLAGVVFTDMCTDLERCSDQAINIATALVRK